ncbi:MAG: hypothetical protein ACOY4I_06725 [Bacillota bacterium]
MLRKKIKYKIFRIVLSTICLLMITLMASGVTQTYAHLTTLARSQTGTADSAKPGDILKFEGAFNENLWQGSGSTGIKITNVTKSRIWVYFEVSGSLRDAVRDITPVGLEPNQSYEVPLEIADAGDMGVLKWRNHGRVFAGEITARVLNNYASYRLGKLEIRSDKLYDKLFTLKVVPGDELSGIKGIQDIINLVAEKNNLIQQVIKLTEENKQLEIANMALQNQVFSLSSALSAANKKISTITAPQVNAVPAGGGNESSTPAAGGNTGNNVVGNGNSGVINNTASNAKSIGSNPGTSENTSPQGGRNAPRSGNPGTGNSSAAPDNSNSGPK